MTPTKTEQRHDAEAEDALHASLHALRERAEIAEKHQHRLEKELPKMRAENQRLTAFLQDAAAFIRVTDTTDNKNKQYLTLETLIHDITGLANDEECFLPRVTGYAKAEADQLTQPV